MMGKWVTAFGAALREARFGTENVPGRTVRLETDVNLSGDAIRLRFGNFFGDAPLRIGAVSLWNGRNSVEITFGGQLALRLAPGGSVQSDTVYLPVSAGDRLKVLLYFPENAPAPHSASGTWQVDYSLPGDYTSQPDFTPCLLSQPYGQPLPALTDIEVMTGEEAEAVVCFGDSITEMRLWFDPFARKVMEKEPGKTAVLNLGVGGNRLLLPTGGKFMEMAGNLFGESGLARLERDVLEKSGVKTVLIALGVNDVSQPGSGEFCPPVEERCTLEEFAAGVTRTVLRLHDAGLRAVCCTITPFGGMEGCCEKTMRLRREINAWLSRRAAAGEIDGLIDFAAAVEDPARPDYMLPECDSGDHLHPSKLGGERMAEKLTEW